MRIPWALFAVFAVGAAAGAATVLLLRPGDAPLVPPVAVATPVPVVVTPSVAERPVPPRPSAAATPASSPPAPRDLALEDILARLEALAAGTASPGPSDNDLVPQLRRQFPDARLRPGLYDALRARVNSIGIEGALPDGDLLARLRTLLGWMQGAATASRVDDMEFARLAHALAGRPGLKGPLVEEFAAHPDARARGAAAVLAEWPPQRPDVLRSLARDTDPRVREPAFSMIEALLDDGTFPGREFEDLIFAGLSDPFPEVRQRCQMCLNHLGAKGAAEAMRILRSGENREAGNVGSGELLQAALAHAPAELLADPLAPHLAEDICLGCGILQEDHPDLVRVLAPHASRLLAVLTPGSREPAERFLTALAWVGEAEVVRRTLGDAEILDSIRGEAAAALLARCPPVDWEDGISAWLRDRETHLGVRWEFLRKHGGGPVRDADDPTRAEATAAWARVLGNVARGADEPELAAEASKMLEVLAPR